MGREVQCECRWADQSGSVKALLESDEIIVRGEIKQRVRIETTTHPQVDAEGLHFAVGRDRVTLAMGEKEAGRWLKKMTTPAPTLREKLGLLNDTKAWVIGPVSDAALKEALRGCTASAPGAARMVIAIAGTDRDLADAARAHKLLGTGAALWIVYTKGKDSTFGEAAVRNGLRAMGYIDTKVASVSTTLTASRFSAKK